MSLSEADTRAKLIDPALHARGWTEDLIRREETAGAVEIMLSWPQPKPFPPPSFAARSPGRFESCFSERRQLLSNPIRNDNNGFRY
jgi:hypothetical protein